MRLAGYKIEGVQKSGWGVSTGVVYTVKVLQNHKIGLLVEQLAVKVEVDQLTSGVQLTSSTSETGPWIATSNSAS